MSAWFSNIVMGLQEIMTLENLLIALIGTVLGIIIGALPGMGPTQGMVLAIPFTYSMKPATALLLLASIYCATMYGGSISAILLNTPGTGGAAATTFDGHPMALKGKAGEALDEAAVASFWGGLISCIALLIIAPPLAKFSLQFSAQEYFAVSLFGLTMIASLSGTNIWKGIAAGMLGMLLGSVGIDPLTAVKRYTFDLWQLEGGLKTTVIIGGLFAITRVFDVLIRNKEMGEMRKIRHKHNIFRDLIRYPFTYLRSGIIGTLVGIVPAAGASIATFISYDMGKKFCKEGDKFGTGVREGVACTEAANNGVTAGALVPTLTLGIPGSTPMAIFYSAMLLHGLQPGYDLFTTKAKITYPFMVGLIVANILMFVIGYILGHRFTFITKVKNNVLGPVIAILMFAGLIASSNLTFNLYLMVGMGAIGLLCKKFDFAIIPIVLGYLLGPITERAMVQGYSLTRSWGAFFSSLFTRPISCVLMVLSFVSIIYAVVSNSKRNKKKEKAGK